MKIPNDLYIIGAVTGALSELAKERHWEQFGAITPQEIAEVMLNMLTDFLDSGGCLIGLMSPYVGVSVPDGTLPCDGATYLKSDFPELYDYLLDTDYIVDSGHFTTPYFSERVVAFASDDKPTFAEEGEAEHTLTVDEMPAHYHEEGIATTSLGLIGEIPELVTIASSSITGYTGGDAPHNNLPPTVYLSWCIVSGRSFIPAPETIFTLFGDTADYTDGIDDTTPLNLGMRFQASVAGQVVGVRIWHRDVDDNDRIAYLWTNSGDLLASADFEDGTIGWVEAIFSSPVDIDPDTTYMVSAYFPDGHFVRSGGGFDSAIVNYPLTGLADGFDGNNGTYVYDVAGTFPDNVFGSTNYWIDVIFQTA